MKQLFLYGADTAQTRALGLQVAKECGRMCVLPEDGLALEEAHAPIVVLAAGTLADDAIRAQVEARGLVVVCGELPNAHYRSFPHVYTAGCRILLPRPLRGKITPPISKSHLHRLLIADFLAGGVGDFGRAALSPCADIEATRRCIAALQAAQKESAHEALLDCGESGSTLRFFAPIAAALGITAKFIRRGRLSARPMLEYPTLEAGLHMLKGDVSSQFVTGLLFALPLLKGDSQIRFSTPLQSRGYVDMTLDVLRRYGIRIVELAEGFDVSGRQRYVSPGPLIPEADWSGAAFWFGANALGSELCVEGLSADSKQPDRVIGALLEAIVAGASEVNVAESPDCYPILAAVNFALGGRTTFTGTERLRLKESDRVAAMEAVFAHPEDVNPQNDHRIAMAAAILSTRLDTPMLLHDAGCVGKSYPNFFEAFALDLYAVTGWPLVKTCSPEIHNAAHAAAGRRAEMISYPTPTIEGALDFAARCTVKGMAVTIPHKQSVMPHLNEIDPVARAIGAVNTIHFKDGRKYGFNTDAGGFTTAITHFMGRDDFGGLRVALLGAGGASKAVSYALQNLNAAVTIFHRRPLDGFYDLIVNATPVDPIPEYVFTGSEAVYDLRYVPAVTPLMARAAAAGCKTENGYSMLKAQALRQLAIWCA